MIEYLTTLIDEYVSPILKFGDAFINKDGHIQPVGSVGDVYKFDIDSDKEFAVSEMGIRSVPTLKIFKGGEVAVTKVGVVPVNELITLING